MIKKQEKKTAICEIPSREINALETKECSKKTCIKLVACVAGAKRGGRGGGRKARKRVYVF